MPAPTRTSRSKRPFTATKRAVRVSLWVARYQLRMLNASGFFVIQVVAQPFVVVVILLLSRPTSGGLHVTLGAAFAGMWSTTIFACGGAMNFLRRLHVLESVVAAPSRSPLC